MKKHLLAVVIATLIATVPVAQAQWVVIDPTNLAQNVMTAAHTLEQINNQIKQLQNQAQSLMNQARNLASLPFNVVNQLRTNLATTQQLIAQAQGLVWRSAQSIVTPYVVEVDKTGEVRAVGEAATPYRPADAQIAFHLARFITLVRSLSIDPIVVRQNWLDAYDYTTDKGAVVLNDYASKNDPFTRVGRESVTVQITSVVRASDSSFNVRWTEQRFVNGAPAGTERWNAVASIVLQTPRTEQRLRKNPLGIYVNGLSWSRELDASEGAKP